MPRLILNSRYLKPDPSNQAARNNLVRYVATRDGVELPIMKNPAASATKKQDKLINQLKDIFPDLTKTFEYEDYLKNPTKNNATALISFVMECHADEAGDNGAYIRYMGHRPGVERIGEHGLFSHSDEPIILNNIAQEVTEHKGNVWSHVISLRREDAARLGYDNARAWQDLLRQEKDTLAVQMKIPPDNLKWYAAFHNEGHHPHVHMIVYSSDSESGYLTKAGIKKLKSVYANEIFRNDLKQIYSEQTIIRDEIKKQAQQELFALSQNLLKDDFCDPAVSDRLIKLSEALDREKGKKVYGYLSRPAKRMVDEIVERISHQETISALYDKWCGLVLERHRTYEDNPQPPVSLVENKEFRKIKNEVVRAALEFPGMGINEKAEPPEPELLSSEPPEDNTESESPSKNPQEMKGETKESAVPVEVERSGYSVKQGRRRKRRQGEPYIEWTKEYKAARELLYGSEAIQKNTEKALKQMIAEAGTGNILAYHDVGLIYHNGMAGEPDEAKGKDFFQKAYAGFMKELDTADEESWAGYLEYRIGKLYSLGYGVEQDAKTAVSWFRKAAGHGNKYAQYSMGNAYRYGSGVEPDNEKAASYYMQSAEQDFDYAQYALGTMQEYGIGLKQDKIAAQENYAKALPSFLESEKKTPDDKLRYRLAEMYRTGKGTSINIPLSVAFYEKAIEDKNSGAAYRLGRMLVEGKDIERDMTRGLALLKLSIEQEDTNAQYFLGKELVKGGVLPQDIARGVKLLEAAVEQQNTNAQYFLGKELVKGEVLSLDIPRGVKLLEAAVEQQNTNAQYFLGKELVKGGVIPRDIPRGVKLLEAAAKQENQFAQYDLGKIHLEGKIIPVDISRALFWLEKSARQDNTPAQYQLGKYYHRMKDYGQAEYWLIRAVAKNDAPYASATLAKLYLDTHRPERAVQLLTTAAQGGYGPASYQLGKLYFFGAEGIQADREQAKMWLQLGASQGDDNAAQLLSELDNWNNQAIVSASASLIRQLGKMIEENYKNHYRHRYGGEIDKKVLLEKQRKKQALGIKDGMV